MERGKNLRFRKYSDTCGQGFFLETESVYNQNRIQRKGRKNYLFCAYEAIFLV